MSLRKKWRIRHLRMEASWRMAGGKLANRVWSPKNARKQQNYIKNYLFISQKYLRSTNKFNEHINHTHRVCLGTSNQYSRHVPTSYNYCIETSLLSFQILRRPSIRPR